MKLYLKQLVIIFLACDKDDDGGISIPKYWKNGEETALSDGVLSTSDMSLFVLDNDVYVLGNAYSGNSITPKIWKNAIEEPLINNIESTIVTDLYVIKK